MLKNILRLLAEDGSPLGGGILLPGFNAMYSSRKMPPLWPCACIPAKLFITRLTLPYQETREFISHANQIRTGKKFTIKSCRHFRTDLPVGSVAAFCAESAGVVSVYHYVIFCRHPTYLGLLSIVIFIRNIVLFCQYFILKIFLINIFFINIFIFIFDITCHSVNITTSFLRIFSFVTFVFICLIVLFCPNYVIFRILIYYHHHLQYCVFCQYLV